jgi:alpha-glucuronidase
MWRAFVYSAENAEDRHKQAYTEFQPLDGKFRDNVLVQVKNGAIDFQPREPFHPLFGAMPKTPLMMEFQITKEYLGFATHLAYLGTMWEEALEADTYRPAKGSTVADVIEKPVDQGAITGMAGVANIGSDFNWSGSQFDQANWYAFGRFAWDPQSRAEDVARDWAHLTWSRDPAVAEPIVRLMMGSRASLRPGALGLGPCTARMEPGLLSQGRCERDRLRPDRDGQRRAGAICAPGRGAVGQPQDRARQPAALVPPCALGLSDQVRPHGVGRSRHAL